MTGSRSSLEAANEFNDARGYQPYSEPHRFRVCDVQFLVCFFLADGIVM